MAGRIVSQAAQFLTILVAARFLGPSEFGVFALLSALAVGLTRVSEAGWREYVLAADTDSARGQANTLAALCGLCSLVLGAICALAWLAYAGPSSGAIVTGVLAVWVLTTTLSATQAGMLVRRSQLRSLAIVQILGEAAGLCVAVAVLQAGGGILGLAAAKLVGQGVVLSSSIAATRWFPLPSLEREAAWKAAHFSRRILATRLIAFLQDNLGMLAVGAFAGPAATGLFRAAARLAGALGEVVSEPIRLHSWSTLGSKGAGVPAARLCESSFVFATPFVVGLAVTAPETVSLLLGQEWAASAPMLSAFAIACWLSMFNAMVEPVLVRGGRIDLVPRIALALMAVNLAVLLCTAPFGVFWIAIGQVIAAALALPLVLGVLHRFGDVSLPGLLKNLLPAFGAAGALALAVWAVGHQIPPGLPVWQQLGLKVFSGAAAYAAAIMLLAPQMLRPPAKAVE